MKTLTIAVFSIILSLCLGGCSSGSAAIGIIGGADGPTAVFVTSRINWPGVFGLIGVIAAVIGIVLVIRHRKRR
ncbi:MAG: sodium ion-translocating decarboxylase subunit beta [Clostridia bacterium]|nr:sodium ion-translocating decarboxylase subunit beta [Clostridia bacterium]